MYDLSDQSLGCISDIKITRKSPFIRINVPKMTNPVTTIVPTIMRATRIYFALQNDEEYIPDYIST